MDLCHDAPGILYFMYLNIFLCMDFYPFQDFKPLKGSPEVNGSVWSILSDCLRSRIS